MEADLDKQEALRPSAGELHGDRLLQTNYVSTESASARRRKVLHAHFKLKWSLFDQCCFLVVSVGPERTGRNAATTCDACADARH